MAFRTWAKLSGATLGVGALAGASQLGLAYGLGILRLTRVVTITTRDQWTAQLAWVAWFAMTAAVVGALTGRNLLAASSARAGAGTRIALALAAGAGAAVVVPLTMQPARTAQIDGVHPVFVIGICAGLGAVAGVFAAYAAMSGAVARWGLIASGAAVWVIAIASVAPSLAPGDPLPAARLGVFDASFLTPSVTQRTALFTMPALALVCGAVLGWAARRRAMPTLTIALAGLPGPALLTAAYLIAGPGSGQDRYQVVPYWAAMTAAGAGVLGSVLAAVLRRGPVEPAAGPVAGETATGEWPASRSESRGDATGETRSRGDGKDETSRGDGKDETSRGDGNDQSRSKDDGTRERKSDGRGMRAARRRRKEAAEAGQGGKPAEPTPDRPPLPRRDARTESAIAQAAAAAAQRPEEQLRPSGTAVFTRPGPPAPAPVPVRTMTRPEPPVVGAPLPNPTPVPRARGKKDQQDGEFVDWVNGLGAE